MKNERCHDDWSQRLIPTSAGSRGQDKSSGRPPKASHVRRRPLQRIGRPRVRLQVETELQFRQPQSPPTPSSPAAHASRSWAGRRPGNDLIWKSRTSGQAERISLGIYCRTCQRIKLVVLFKKFWNNFLLCNCLLKRVLCLHDHHRCL